MRAVNLLPREIKRERKKAPVQQLVAVVGMVAITLLLAMMFMSKSSQVSQAQTQLDLANDELASIPPALPADPAQPQLRQAQSAKLTALEGALAKRVSWDRVLRQFSQVLPDDVWLTTLSAAAPGAVSATGGANGQFTLNGYSYSHDSVARLLARLQLVPELTNVTLQTSAKVNLAGREIVQFTITAQLRSAGAAS